MTPHLTPERLAEIRRAIEMATRMTVVGQHAVTLSAQSAAGLIAELDAVTRERDEARKDSARLDWLATKLTDPWPIAHSDWDREPRAAIDAEMSSDSAASNEERKPEATYPVRDERVLGIGPEPPYK